MNQEIEDRCPNFNDRISEMCSVLIHPSVFCPYSPFPHDRCSTITGWRENQRQLGRFGRWECAVQALCPKKCKTIVWHPIKSRN